MLSTMFDDALERLLMAHDRYRRTPRNPDNVVGLSRARAQLDLARAEVHAARAADPQARALLARRIVPRSFEDALRVWSDQFGHEYG